MNVIRHDEVTPNPPTPGSGPRITQEGIDFGTGEDCTAPIGANGNEDEHGLPLPRDDRPMRRMPSFGIGTHAAGKRDSGSQWKAQRVGGF